MIQQASHLAQANSNIAVLWLYGFRAKGTEQASSDYDFAIAFNHFLKMRGSAAYNQNYFAKVGKTLFQI